MGAAGKHIRARKLWVYAEQWLASQVLSEGAPQPKDEFIVKDKSREGRRGQAQWCGLLAYPTPGLRAAGHVVSS